MIVRHIQTNATAPDDVALVEASLRGLDGVSATTSIAGIGLTSILFDEHLVDEVDIVEAVRSVGFQPHLVARAS